MTLFNAAFNPLKAIADKLGYKLIAIRKKTCKFGYEKVLTRTIYSPWLTDKDFVNTYKLVEDYSLVDRYRGYEIWHLVKESAKLQEGAFLEVGVWRGGSGALIAKCAELNGTKDTIYLCDTFKGVVKAGAEDSIYKGGEHADASKEAVEGLIKKLNLKNVKILSGIFPDETAQNIDENEKFRFCHIDVDVYQGAKEITEWIWPKLCVGGIIVYDDYGFVKFDGMRKYVDESGEKEDRLIMYNLNGHAIAIKLK